MHFPILFHNGIITAINSSYKVIGTTYFNLNEKDQTQKYTADEKC